MRTAKGLELEGRYRLDSLIATGGMGEVWRGWDEELDREVAVKVLREEYAFDEGFLKRFRAEARHTASLSHDTIAALYDYGELDGRAYIVMELCAGVPLSEIIERNPHGLPTKRVIGVLTDLARALDAAHAKGVVHRDVKPENVLVDEEHGWALKITDFGIARSQDQARLTKSGLVMGTAQYLSPEQAMGKQATSLSDIYSLGIVAYEMLVGHRPFTGSSQVEIAMAQVKKQPPALPETIDEDLRHLVMMCLAKAPANRPRSAAAVARILEAIQRGDEPHFTTGAVPVTTSGAPVRRSPSGPPPRRSGASARSASGATAASGASPTGSRTAAMPLPMSGRRRGVHHRSGMSAGSGMSAPSPARPGRGGRPRSGSSPAPPVGPDGNPLPPSGVDSPNPPRIGREDGAPGAAPGRTVRATSTGRRIGPFSVPGLVLILVILVIVVAAIAGFSGSFSSSMGPVPALDGGSTDTVTSASTSQAAGAGPPQVRTMTASVLSDHCTRTGEL
jgi:serine/threonine protein kinase